MGSPHAFRWLVPVPSVVAYGASLQMTALQVSGRDLSGTYVLARGWLGVFTGDLAWFANPLYLLALVLVLFKCYRSGACAALVGAAVGLLSASADAWWFAENRGTPIDGLGLGFQVWEASFLLLFLGALVLWLASGYSSRPKPLPGSA